MRIGIPSAIAACVVLSLALLLTNGATQSASAAEQLREVTKVSDAYPGWIHITTESIHVPASQTTTQPVPKNLAMHMNGPEGTFITVMESNQDRTVFFLSTSRNEMTQYDSKTNQIVKGALNPVFAKMMNETGILQATPKGLLQTMASKKKQTSKVTRSREGELDCFTATLSGPTGRPETLTILANPKTQLIQKIRIEQNGMRAVYRYTYGPPEIKDIYDVGVPRDAKVVDNRPAQGAQEVTKRLEARIRKGFGDGIAVLTASAPDKPRGLLTIFATQGEKMLTLQYRAGTPNKAPGGCGSFCSPEGLPEGWPRPGLEEVRRIMDTAKPVQYFVLDGTQAWVGWYNSGEKAYSKQHFPPSHLARFPNSLQAEQGLAGRIWPSPQMRMWFGPQTKVEVLHDAKRDNQIGLCVETMSSPTQNTKQRNMSIFWLDPARDDMPVEKVHKTLSANGKTSKRKDITRYLDYAQLPNGQWYPTRWQTVRDGKSGEYILQIFPGAILSNEWFAQPPGNKKRSQ